MTISKNFVAVKKLFQVFSCGYGTHSELAVLPSLGDVGRKRIAKDLLRIIERIEN